MDVERIVSKDPEVVSGELVFAGTRVPVRTLIDHLKAGESLKQFLEGFPSVSREQAEAYLELSVAGADALRWAKSERGESEVSEREWLGAAVVGGSFDFLADPREDIYSTDDGQPFADEG